MEEVFGQGLVSHFNGLEDFRINRRKQHILLDIVVISICAVICGCEGWDAMSAYGEIKHDWLKTFLELPNGIPCADTFRRVLSRIAPKAFHACFLSWVESLRQAAGGKLIAIDGKTVRSSFDAAAGQSAIHMVSAFAVENRLTLAQLKVSEKSNEITAVPALLDMLDVKGCVVTADAMGCQVDIAEKIKEKGGDYVLALKGNQGEIHEAVVDHFANLKKDGKLSEVDFHESADKGHGRLEERSCWAAPATGLDQRNRWPSLESVVMVESKRTIKGVTTVENRYYLSSLAPDATVLSGAIRGKSSTCPAFSI